MINYMPFLCKDAYKGTHADQYHPDITKLVAYLTPRMSRLSGIDKCTVFGPQAFIKEYLMEAMDDNFFKVDAEIAIASYLRYMRNIMGTDGIGYDRLKALHDLQYLPLEIYVLPEGTRSEMGVPQVCITNTLPEYVWLVNVIESMMSCTLWHTQVSAEVGYRYRKIVDKYVDLTCDDDVIPERLVGDFSMRGQESIESATKSSAAWLLSFYNTATIPASIWLERYYNCNVEKEIVGLGAISTEHSTMCSARAIDGDEITFIRKLLTEKYPNQSFSMVCDSIDYWNLIKNILPQLKEEILNHKGYLGIRGDSGNPVDIIIGTAEAIMDEFGYTVNSKGYKVLPPQMRIVYGDSITPQVLSEAYAEAESRGISISNFMLAAGSFSMQCLEEVHDDGTRTYAPYTRDTFSVAVKTTYGEVGDTPIEIFKDPVTDTGNFKKSQRGCIRVFETGTGYGYQDGLTWGDSLDDNCLELVFKDGKLVRDMSLKEVRNNLATEHAYDNLKGGF